MLPLSRLAEPTTCKYCQALLSGALGERFCNKLSCRLKGQQDALHRMHNKRRDKERDHNEVKERIKQRWQRRNQAYTNHIPIVEVPHHNPGIETIDHKRKKDFENHLHKLITSLDDVSEEKKFTSPQGKQQEHKLGPVLARACSACNGKCCRQGFETFGFIQRATLLRVIEQYPELNADEIIGLYMSHIPRVANRRSCVFHTTEGCALAEDLRADICNEFFCWNLSQHIKHNHQDPPGAKTLVFSVENFDIKLAHMVTLADTEDGEMADIEKIEV